eukprot:3138333-Rhodomonas_salina.3
MTRRGCNVVLPLYDASRLMLLSASLQAMHGADSDGACHAISVKAMAAVIQAAPTSARLKQRSAFRVGWLRARSAVPPQLPALFAHGPVHLLQDA